MEGRGWSERGWHACGWGDRSWSSTSQSGRGGNDRDWSDRCWSNHGRSDRGWSGRGWDDRDWGDRRWSNHSWGDVGRSGRGWKDRGWSDHDQNGRSWSDGDGSDRGWNSCDCCDSGWTSHSWSEVLDIDASDCFCCVFHALQLSSLIDSERVCRRWHFQIGIIAPVHPGWKLRTCCNLPFPEAWRTFTPEPADGFYQAALSVQALRKRLQTMWTVDLRASFGTFKYSKWVCYKESPEFILYVAFALRAFYLTAPRACFSLDGSPQRSFKVRITPFDASHWPWWAVEPQRLCDAPQRVSKHALLALLMMEHAAHPHRRPLINGISYEDFVYEAFQWWGIEDPAVRSELFNIDAVVELVTFLLDCLCAEESGWTVPSWQEGDGFVAEVMAVFGDVDNLACRGIAECAAGQFPEFAFLFDDPFFDTLGEMEERQIPPMINLVKLVEHVERRRRERR